MNEGEGLPPSEPPKPASPLSVAAIIGIGWMCLSGLCTAYYAGPLLISGFYQWIGLIGLFIGIVSALFGYAILQLGKAPKKNDE